MLPVVSESNTNFCHQSRQALRQVTDFLFDIEIVLSAAVLSPPPPVHTQALGGEETKDAAMRMVALRSTEHDQHPSNGHQVIDRRLNTTDEEA